MTLVIGIPCFDGFVIAADSQETYGTRNHVQKISVSRLGGYELVIGMCGESIHARTAADLVSEAIFAKKGPNVLVARKIIRHTIKDFYRGLPEFTSPNGSRISDVELIIGYRDKRGYGSLYQAAQSSVALVHRFAAIGSGAYIANQIGARVFHRFGTAGMETAIARHWATQVMREGRLDANVGGNSEVWSVRYGPPKGMPFFDIPDPHVQDGYLWGAQQHLFWAIENALLGNQAAVDKRLSEISKTLTGIVKAQATSPRDHGTVKHDTDSPPAGYGRF